MSDAATTFEERLLTRMGSAPAAPAVPVAPTALIFGCGVLVGLALHVALVPAATAKNPLPTSPSPSSAHGPRAPPA